MAVFDFPANRSMITSPANEKVRLIRSLQSQRRAREREGRFVAEGVRLLEAALAAPEVEAAFVLYREDLAAEPRLAALLEGLRARDIPVLAASEAVLRAASDTQTPQGIVGVFAIPSPASVAARAPAGDLVLVADRVRDPGNLGALLRTAAAAGASDVLLAPGTVDAYNPKVVRSAMGAHFSLALVAADWATLGGRLVGRAVWLAEARGGQAPWEADLHGPLALVVGGEAEGAGPEAHSLATGRLTVPLAAGVESLNASAAAAMILYEVLRQRKSFSVESP